VIELVMGALAAAYGIWLLRRDQHRHAAHSGRERSGLNIPETTGSPGV
jgi:hypothetical protein